MTVPVSILSESNRIASSIIVKSHKDIGYSPSVANDESWAVDVELDACSARSSRTTAKALWVEDAMDGITNGHPLPDKT